MQRLLRATVIVLLIGTLFLYPLLAPPPHRIDEAHFQVIAEGMTEAEVDAIFGVPAGSYDWARPKMEYIYLEAVVEAQQLHLRLALNRSIEKHELGVRLTEPSPTPPVHETRNWISRHGAFGISLDERGRVVSKHHGGETRIEFPWRPLWQKLTGN
jgi:hypothetical protein